MSKNTNDLEQFLITLQSMIPTNDPNYAYRKKAYQVALEMVRSGDDLSDIDTRKIPGLGDRMKKRILYFYGRGAPVDDKDVTVLDEILSGGGESTEMSQVLQVFQTIEGVGPITAEKWYKKGYRTIQELIDNPPSGITGKQLSGLKHHETLVQRIPRQDIEQYEKELMRRTKGRIEFTIAGSYRRKKPTSGDIDILVLLKGTEKTKEITRRVFISTINFIEILASGEKKINGIANVPHVIELGGVIDIPRRVDIEFTSRDQYPLALLYFTGSADFNRKMRGIADNLGFHLDEKYLSTPYTEDLSDRLVFWRIFNMKKDNGNYGYAQVTNVEELNQNQLPIKIVPDFLTSEERNFFEETGNLYIVQVDSEQDVFQILGMDYVEPEDR